MQSAALCEVPAARARDCARFDPPRSDVIVRLAPHNAPPSNKGGSMLEDHLKSPITRQRLRTSLVGPHIDAFADWLHQRGYKAIVIDLRLRSLASWASW